MREKSELYSDTKSAGLDGYVRFKLDGIRVLHMPACHLSRPDSTHAALTKPTGVRCYRWSRTGVPK